MAVAPATSVHEVPPSALTCHCTVGVGLPTAAAEKVTVLPGRAARACGCAVTTGAAPVPIPATPMLFAPDVWFAVTTITPAYGVIAVGEKVTVTDCTPPGGSVPPAQSPVKPAG